MSRNYPCTIRGCFHGAMEYCSRHSRDDVNVAEEILKTGAIPDNAAIVNGALSRIEGLVPSNDPALVRHCAVFIYVHNQYHGKESASWLEKIPSDDTLVYFYACLYVKTENLLTNMTLAMLSNIYALKYIATCYTNMNNPSEERRINEIGVGYKIPACMEQLGYRLVFIEGGEENVKRGLELLKEAAAAGHNQANRSLGIYYLDDRDKPLGLMYLKRAVNEATTTEPVSEYENLESMKKLFSNQLDTCDPVAALILAEYSTDEKEKYYNLLYILFALPYVDLAVCNTSYYLKGKWWVCSIQEVVKILMVVNAHRSSIARLANLIHIASARGCKNIATVVLNHKSKASSTDEFIELLLELIRRGTHIKILSDHVPLLVKELITRESFQILRDCEKYIADSIKYCSENNMQTMISLVYLCVVSKGAVPGELYKPYVARTMDYWLKNGPKTYAMAKLMCKVGADMGDEHCILRMELMEMLDKK